MTDQVTLGLCREEQIDAYENARKAVEARLDDPTHGEVVQELAEAYTGHYSYDVETATSTLGIDTSASDGIRDPTLTPDVPELDDVSAEEIVEELEAEPGVGEADEPPTSPPLLLRLTARFVGWLP